MLSLVIVGSGQGRKKISVWLQARNSWPSMRHMLIARVLVVNSVEVAYVISEFCLQFVRCCVTAVIDSCWREEGNQLKMTDL